MKKLGARLAVLAPMCWSAQSPANEFYLGHSRGLNGRSQPTSPVAASLNFTRTTPSGLACATFAACFSSSRTSNATMIDSTGKLTYAPNNLIANSNAPSSWVNLIQSATVVTQNATTNSITGDPGASFVFIGGGYYYNVPTSPVTVVGLKYALCGWVWSPVATGTAVLRVVVTGGASAANVVTLSTTPQHVCATVTADVAQTLQTGIDNRTIVGGDNVSKTVYGSNFTLSQITYETPPRAVDQVITTTNPYYGPRFDYSGGSLAGLLVEPARTNIAVYSSTLNSWPNKSNITIGTGATSPDSTTNAQPVTDTATNANHSAYIIPSSTASSTYSTSVFVQPSAGRYFGLSEADVSQTAGGYANFDLSGLTVTQSGALGVGSFVGASFQPGANGYNRISVTATLGTGTTCYQLLHVENAATYTKDSLGRGAYAGGSNTYNAAFFQSELGSYPTSYIPNPASAGSTARAVDVPAAAGPLETALAAGPSMWEFKDEATGVISRTAYATGAFSAPVGKWYRLACAYKAGTPTAYATARAALPNGSGC